MALKKFVLLALSALVLAGTGCVPAVGTSPAPVATTTTAPGSVWSRQKGTYPKIASWLAKKDEIIASEKPYSLVMTGWFTPEEAAAIKSFSPQAILLAGLSLNWVWDNAEWMAFLLTIANYGRDTPFTINEDMYLHRPDGARVAFGWASEAWGHEEIYAMDPRNPDWVDLITTFYKNVLDQPQHDGIIIDMVTEYSWCPEVISDAQWEEATKAIFAKVKAINTANKPVIINAGGRYSDIDAYTGYIDGFLMENFMGAQVLSTFEEGLSAAGNNLVVIYAADTEDTGIKDPAKMRLGLVLSMLFDNTYFTYDVGPRDHGQAWWFPEYDVDLGAPLGPYFKQGEAFYREFEKGTVVAAPYANAPVSFTVGHTDVSTGEKALNFNVKQGDARIFILSE